MTWNPVHTWQPLCLQQNRERTWPQSAEPHKSCFQNDPIFNSRKYQTNAAKLPFTFSAVWIKPDLEKIQAITSILPPADSQQFESFLGMINFMQPCIPHLSHHTALCKNSAEEIEHSTGTVTQIQPFRNLSLHSLKHRSDIFNIFNGIYL